jgi:uncharacterized membrane protein
MKKFLLASLIILTLITGSLNFLLYSGGSSIIPEELNPEGLDSDIENEQELELQTRSDARVPKMSSWDDTFDDDSKIWSSDFTTQKDGEVRSSIIGGRFYPSGNIITYPITSDGACRWGTFHADYSDIKYKRVITIDNTQNTNDLTGYSVSFKMDTQSLISSGLMKADCGDIRIYDDSGAELPYWIEYGINTASTEIWVNVTSIPASEVSYIYLDYGNPGLSSKSNPYAVFDYFDDFSGASYGYDTSYWRTHTDGPFIFSRSQEQSYSGSYVMKARYTGTYDYTALIHDYNNQALKNKMVTVHFYDLAYQEESLCDLQVGRTGDFMRFQTDINSDKYRYRDYYNGGYRNSQIMGTRTTGWHELQAALTDTSVSFYYDGAHAYTRSITNYEYTRIGYSANWGGGITHYYDAYFLRPYSNPEPSASIGPEPIVNDVYITFKILKASDDSELMTVLPDQILTGLSEESIKLKAEFSSDGGGTVMLKEWGIDWNTLPVIDDISPATSVNLYRTESMFISINGTDVEDLENEMGLTVEYKSPKDTGWQTGYLSIASYNLDFWRCVFTPPDNSDVGTYSFRIAFTDSCSDTCSDEELKVNVLNNIPAVPEVSITPGIELEVWYSWFMDDVLQAVYDNISIMPSAVTEKHETWMCAVTVFDGLDTAPKVSVERLIKNSKPIYSITFDDVRIAEDSTKTLPNILHKVFSDADLDLLYFDSSGEDYIDVDISQGAGTVTFTPLSNWIGTEYITFYANDTESQAEATVSVEVTPVNDLPEIVQIGSQIISDEYPELEFMVKQDDDIRLKVLAKDLDGDDKRGMIKFLLNITESPTYYFDEINNELIFQPSNADVGWHYIEIKVTDNNETPVEYIPYKFKIFVINENDPPSVEITEPLNSPELTEGDKITFKCTADDIDFLIPKSTEYLAYRWYVRTPEIVELGTGKELINPKLAAGSYTLTIEVTDSSNATATDSMLIYVKEAESESTLFFGESNSWVGAIFIIIVIAILISIFFIITFRKKRKEAIQAELVQAGAGGALTSPYTGAAVGPAPTVEAIATPVAQPVAAQPTAQIPPSATPSSVQTYSLSADKSAGMDSSLTKDDKLKLLDERLLKGEIDQDLYRALKTKIEAEVPVPQPQVQPTARLPPVQTVSQPEPAVASPQPQPQPVAQPIPAVQQNLCSSCGQPLRYIEQRRQYYCYNCSKYQ